MAPFLRASSEAAARAVADLELPWNRYGIDPFGVSKHHLTRMLAGFGWLYRHYFRVRAHGLEHVPRRGRAMLVGNHSGGIALDAAMILTSLLLDGAPPRLAHGMAEKFIAALPFAAEWTSRCGQFTGLPEHARRLLDAERLLLVFPEGAAGTAKLFPERHSLVRFGSGFMRLALEARAPVVPVAFLGGGEAVPTIHNSYRLGRALGVPYVPFTPYGPPLPLPVRLDVLYGAPMHFEGDGSEHDDVIAAQVERVRARIGAMSDLGLAYRGGHIDEARLCSELRGAPT